MRTIVVTSTKELWQAAQKAGTYMQSIIEAPIGEVGFIHATSPDQTIAMLNRRYGDRNDIILLLVDLAKVTAEVKFEASSSGRTPGLFPHIYGPLNIDAVYNVITPAKDSTNSFTETSEHTELAL